MREEGRAKCFSLLHAPPRCEKSRCLIETAADVKSERSDQQTEQKRQAPTPAVDRFAWKNACDKCTQERASKHRQTLADHLPGAIEAAAFRRRGFDEECCGTGEFTSGRESLE